MARAAVLATSMSCQLNTMRDEIDTKRDEDKYGMASVPFWSSKAKEKYMMLLISFLAMNEILGLKFEAKFAYAGHSL